MLNTAFLTFFMIFAGVSVIVMIWCFWALVANEITYRQVMQIHRWVFGPPYNTNPDYLDRLAKYNKVTYDQHFHAVLFFRNPRKLYPDEVRRVF